MEQTPFVMWSKRRLGASNPINDDSWEEQAFAEDAAGALGGCIWPPRSYSCSFCRREFRSAQALGGHMNVHRRDRARFNQSPDPNQMSHLDQAGHDSIPPQIHQLFHNPSPKSALGAATTPISPPELLRCPADIKIPPYLSSFPGEFRDRLSGGVGFVPARSNSFSKNCFHITGCRSEKNNKLSLKKQRDYGHKTRSDLVESNSLMGLNLATQTPSSFSDDDDEEEEDTMTSTTLRKRRRTDEPFVPVLLKRTLQAVVHVDELSNNAGEELDLELRLGDRPKGKLPLS
ncbi:hypothetical protein MLD38_029945 [Melastoma candidum]|uniref:Uncharacterized protein n=1 Tax=Melastoma candidum TaxID=119954 RepID=A0ACB9MKC5_9MYRT|nr:hypothetical protein MLD38_029945 [Melastoma candidum]